MKNLVHTYRGFVYFTFAILLCGCGAESMDQVMDEEATSEEVSATKEMSMAEEEASEATIQQSSSKTASSATIKWKKKAKQQLESIEDLALILKDPTLDIDFKLEIEKELNSLYIAKDSSMYNLSSQELNFKKFKDLKIENKDTMSLQFSNKKELLKAEFIIVNETKYFGETTEVVEQLKIVSIKKEN